MISFSAEENASKMIIVIYSLAYLLRRLMEPIP